MSDFIGDDETDPMFQGDIFDPVEQEQRRTGDKDKIDTEANVVHETIAARKRAYASVFSEGTTSAADLTIVTEDLRRFCRADTSTFTADQRTHALLEGRRETWLHIHDLTSLSVDELVERHERQNLK